MTSIETRNRRLRYAFIFVVSLIVILFIAEVVLVIVMLTRNNGSNGQTTGFSEADANRHTDLTNKSVVAVGGHLIDRRVFSTANPQEKTTKLIDLIINNNNGPPTTNPEIRADENYRTKSFITGTITATFAHSAAQDGSRTGNTGTGSSPPTIKLSTESNYGATDSTFASDDSISEAGDTVSPTFSTETTQASIDNFTTGSHISQAIVDSRQRPSSSNAPKVTSRQLNTNEFTSTDALLDTTTNSGLDVNLGTPVSTETTSGMFRKTVESSTFFKEAVKESVNVSPTRFPGRAGSTTKTYHAAEFETTADTIFSTEESDANINTTAVGRDDETLLSTPDSETIQFETTANTIFSTEENDADTHITMVSQDDNILLSTVKSTASEFETTADTIYSTEESDADSYTTTESAELEKWMDITTIVSASSNSLLHAVKQPTIQPTIALSSNSTIDTVNPNRPSIHDTTPVSLPSNSVSQKSRKSTTSQSTNELLRTTSSGHSSTSTTPTKLDPSSNLKTILPEHNILPISSTTASSIVTTTTKPEICGIRYGEKCYTLIVGDLDYYDAQKICRIEQGKLADITSRQHYNIIMAYIKHLIPESKQNLEAWTAMTLMLTTGTVRLSNFRTASFTRWYPGQPQQDFNRRNIYLHVSKITSNPQGMVNDNPKAKLSGALCVTNKRSTNRG